MKDLQHYHLAKFYGACLEYPNLCLLTEYCPRGSLFDLLKKNRFKNDWMVQLSLIQDITLVSEYFFIVFNIGIVHYMNDM